MVLNVSCNVNEIVDVALLGTPVPNSGVFLATAPSISAPTVVQYIQGTASNFQLKAISAGTCTVFVTSKNAQNVQFPVDQINFTVANPTPDATGSGITVSAPHS